MPPLGAPRLVVCLTLVGCSATALHKDVDGSPEVALDASPGPDAGTVPDLEREDCEGPGWIDHEHVCEELMRARCSGLEACGCGPVDEDDCFTDGWLLCPLNSLMDLGRAIEDGSVSYDGCAAGALVQHVAEATAACERPAAGGLAALWRGTREPGEPCEGLHLLDARGQCRDYCQQREGPGLCVELVGEGDPCDDQHLCLLPHERPLLVVDLGITATLRCDERTATCVIVRAADGESCNSWDDCRSGRCVRDTCAPPATLGESCENGTDCGTGFCDGGSCAADGELGASCFEEAQCESGVCLARSCALPVCAAAVGHRGP